MTEQREIRLFGALGRFGQQQKLLLDVGPDATVANLRQALAARLAGAEGFDPRLLDESVFADEHDILAENARPDPRANLAVLPPVCGG